MKKSILCLNKAKKIMGHNFIGPEELERISGLLNIKKPSKINKPLPPIYYSEKKLKSLRTNNILILGINQNIKGKPLNINELKKNLGTYPLKSKPCFYNQDWYLKEKFATKTLDYKWYLISKKIKPQTKKKNPDYIQKTLKNNEIFPSAILVTYTFFAYYFCRGKKMLWQNEFIWCSDKDHNGDRIYVGRYLDPSGVNKNGFNIHRHLKICSYYGLAPQIINKN